MNKKIIYKQIQDFNNKHTDSSDTSSKTFREAYLYVSDEEAVDKAEFIKYLISQNKLLNKYSKIIDLTFGSGNLTSHIILDTEIEYSSVIFNDINTEKTNQGLALSIPNFTITQNNILDDSSFEGIDYDLVIINPQIGGSYTYGDILKQKENDEKNDDILYKLTSTLNKFYENGTTIIFYGKEKDFNSLFKDEKFYQYKSDTQNLFIIKKDIEKTLCFGKDKNSFTEIDCKEENNSDVAIESFDLIDSITEEYISDDTDVKIKNTEEQKEKLLNEKKGNLKFPHKNILFKGVPGTGKSKTVDDIIQDEDKLNMKELPDNVLRINIHSASSNSDLMQGISISTTEDNRHVIYTEKRGSVLKHIIKAIYRPVQPFVLVLEEIQENSLNELIGDLIYLIEDTKRTEVKLDEQMLSYEELIKQINPEHFVELPSLVESSDTNTKMIIPNNLYIFCTSNYRDDKKVIEDNLLRRFDVIEMYPKYGKIFQSKDVSDFLKILNEEILKSFSDEIHPDRNIIGHANWLNIGNEKNDTNKKLFYKALLKVIIEFKEIREVEFDSSVKLLFSAVFQKNDELSETIKSYLEIFYIEGTLNLSTYKEIVETLQQEIYSSFI